jgi:alkanesulfonate monooxygenase SsuD/methylene tetrahydromethanopterin reductase-like flavin-dependent oxidoreductase (luciferase family)
VPELGYSLSCEEHSPNDLVRFAKRAEDAGIDFALISDHFHPWIDHVYIHQIGADQEGFFTFAERELLPRL